MDEKNKYYLGIDIGGTKCAVVLGDQNFNILKKFQFDTRTQDRSWQFVMEEFFNVIDKIIHDHPGIDIHRIGLSCGGPLDSTKGMIYSPPNLPGWDEVPIVEVFRNRYNIPAAVQNHANACALAEWLMGAGKGTSNMIFLTFGTGMGAGLILNGRLYSGTNDLGGEAGHIRLAEKGPVGFGKAGSFEGFCSGGGIAQLAKSLVSEKLKQGITVGFCPEPKHLDLLNAKIVAGAAANGDKTAVEIIEMSAAYLGKGLAVLIDILNPECIVIGSIYARNVQLFKPQMERTLKEEAIPAALEVCAIKPAELGDSIGDYAALCVAVYDEMFNK